MGEKKWCASGLGAARPLAGWRLFSARFCGGIARFVCLGGLHRNSYPLVPRVIHRKWLVIHRGDGFHQKTRFLRASCVLVDAVTWRCKAPHGFVRLAAAECHLCLPTHAVFRSRI